MKTVTLYLLLFTAFVLNAQQPDIDYAWLDTSLPIETRAEKLVTQMTLEEKVSQMMNASPAIPRLGIPAYNWWNEALHGIARGGKATVFPQSIGLGATFDTELMQEIGTTISDEARAIYNQMIKEDKELIQYMGLTFWSPNVNIFRDPRWGRGQETYGEDPFLTGSLGSAFIRGMQGDDPNYLKTATCAKHFAVHNGPEELRHGFNAVASQKDLYETYLPAFKMCVDADVEAIMCAYNRTNGEPCCGSETLLQNILRNDWNFDGHIVSDCGAVGDIYTGHHYVDSPEAAAAFSLINTVNVNCGSYYNNLPAALNKGLITEETIDSNLVQLLKTRFKLGMFDPPADNPYSSISTDVINSKEHQKLALDAARKSIVLLQNKNNVLPLKKDEDFIYICGPLADRNISLIGNYYGMSPNLVTILEGITEKVSHTTKVYFNIGSLLSTPNANPIDWFSGSARQADATIAVVGYSFLLEGEEGEAHASSSYGDNPSLKLPKNQIDFLKKLKRNNDKPLIAVVCAGSPIDVTEIKDLADAIVYAWYPGEQGGRAVADIIFGDVSPSGKLPITFPVSVDQLPPFEDYSMEGRTYKYMQEKPQYPFGYGLSYSKFEFSDLLITRDKNTNSIKVQCEITNSGTLTGEEVAQLYLSFPGVNERIPISELKAFKRINLEPGKTKEIRFELKSKEFRYVDSSGENKNYKGKVIITVGNASPGERSRELGAQLLTNEIDY